jgi:hypothetical protein
VTDRGPRSVAASALLARLSREARALGSRVVTLLGNHCMMNLVGDVRYVSPSELMTLGDGGAADGGGGRGRAGPAGDGGSGGRAWPASGDGRAPPAKAAKLVGKGGVGKGQAAGKGGGSKAAPAAKRSNGKAAPAAQRSNGKAVAKGGSGKSGAGAPAAANRPKSAAAAPPPAPAPSAARRAVAGPSWEGKAAGPSGEGKAAQAPRPAAAGKGSSAERAMAVDRAGVTQAPKLAAREGGAAQGAKAAAAPVASGEARPMPAFKGGGSTVGGPSSEDDGSGSAAGGRGGSDGGDGDRREPAHAAAAEETASEGSAARRAAPEERRRDEAATASAPGLEQGHEEGSGGPGGRDLLEDEPGVVKSSEQTAAELPGAEPSGTAAQLPDAAADLDEWRLRQAVLTADSRGGDIRGVQSGSDNGGSDEDAADALLADAASGGRSSQAGGGGRPQPRVAPPQALPGADTAWLQRGGAGAGSAAAMAAAMAAAEAIGSKTGNNPDGWPVARQRAALAAGLDRWAALLGRRAPLGRALRGKALLALEGTGGCKTLFVHAGTCLVAVGCQPSSSSGMGERAVQVPCKRGAHANLLFRHTRAGSHRPLSRPLTTST